MTEELRKWLFNKFGINYIADISFLDKYTTRSTKIIAESGHTIISNGKEQRYEFSQSELQKAEKLMQNSI